MSTATPAKRLEDSQGYKSLLAAVQRDVDSGDNRAMPHFAWIIARIHHYADKTGVDAGELLTKWESKRSYWYMNFYQDANQPKLDDSVRVFQTLDELMRSLEGMGFRCPNCKGESSNPYQCNSGLKVKLINGGKEPETCNWKSYGLFGTLGKGVSVFVVSELSVEHFFMPLAWEYTKEIHVTEAPTTASEE
jgi:hypothetical protein